MKKCCRQTSLQWRQSYICECREFWCSSGDWRSRCLWHGHEHLWSLRLEQVPGHGHCFQDHDSLWSLSWNCIWRFLFSLILESFLQYFSVLVMIQGNLVYIVNAHIKKHRFIMQNSNLDFRLKAFMTQYYADCSGRTCYVVLDISNTGLTDCNPAWICVLLCSSVQILQWADLSTKEAYHMPKGFSVL